MEYKVVKIEHVENISDHMKYETLIVLAT